MHADVRLERFRLHSAYRPEPLDLPIRIFTPEPEHDAAATWRPLFPGSFDAVATPDPHDGEAQLRAAQQALGEHWRELEDAGPGPATPSGVSR